MYFLEAVLNFENKYCNIFNRKKSIHLKELFCQVDFIMYERT